MSYSDFKSVPKVARKFHLKVKEKPFIAQMAIEISDIYFSDMKRWLGDSMNFINEITICAGNPYRDCFFRAKYSLYA